MRSRLADGSFFAEKDHFKIKGSRGRYNLNRFFKDQFRNKIQANLAESTNTRPDLEKHQYHTGLLIFGKDFRSTQLSYLHT